MKYRSALAHVQGLGTAKSGIAHWWMQRLTAIALVPLSLWFGFMIISIAGGSYEAAIQWLGSPLQVALMIAFVIALMFHAQLGLQVVIEDYVHSEGTKIVSLVVVKLAACLATLIAIVSVFTIHLGN